MSDTKTASARTPAQKPTRRRRRNPADMLLGAGALLLLVCLLVGVPFALVTLAGLSIPRQLPTLQSLQQPISAQTLMNILAAVLWLAWIQFAACVIVEVVAEVRGVGLPSRVPLAGGTQALSHRLVATALLLFTATAMIAPAVIGTTPARGPVERRPAITSQATTGNVGGPGSTAAPGLRAVVADADTGLTARHTGVSQAGPMRHAASEHAVKLHIVQPPHGRHHESLWELAERHLGDGRRYPEIFELNKGRVQPDGSKLTIASLIRPGWVLQMPPGAYDLTEVIREAPASAEAQTRPEAAAAPSRAAVREVPSTAAAKSDVSAITSTSLAQGGLPKQASVPAASGSQADDRRAAVAAVDRAAQSEASDLLMRELAAASLLGAGLLVALGRRRRRQLWRRAFGTRLPHPEGDAADAERTLLLSADPGRAHALDRALRSLSVACAARDTAPPSVYAAAITDGEILLRLAPAEREAPGPWTASDDGKTWRLPLAAVSNQSAASADALAPYPGLVCIGKDGSAQLLLDLEAAHGVIALTGPQERRVEVLAAMAAELATNLWSDHLRVTLVGFGAELVVLAPDRVRAADSLGEVLGELELRAAETTRALAAIGTDSVLTGRSRGAAGDAWMPHFVLVAQTPAPEELARLSALTGQGRRNPTGFVVAGDVPAAAWTLQLQGPDDERLVVLPLDLEVEAQRLPATQYAGVVELFTTAAKTTGIPYAEALAPPGFDARSLPDPDAQMDVDIKLLGAIDIRAPHEVDEERLAVCTELLVYLALHPDGVHPTVLGSAIWPRGVTAGVRDAAIARVRDWVGRDATGRPHLAVREDGRIALGPGVRCDWTSAQLLMRLAGQDGQQEASCLGSALRLIRGPLVADRPLSRYTWLAATSVPFEVSARLADAAHRLAEIRLAEGDAIGAISAVRQGLLIAGDDEQLWQDLLRSAHASGDSARLREIATEIGKRGGDDMAELNPHTEALVDELYPAWRISAVR